MKKNKERLRDQKEVLKNKDTEEEPLNEEIPTSRKKRRLSIPATWKYNTMKKNREMGLEYLGRKGNQFIIEKNKKTLKALCNCTKKQTKKEETKIQCYKLTEDNRGYF